MVTHRFKAMKDQKGYITQAQVDQLIAYFKKRAKQYDKNSSNYLKNMRFALLIYVLWKTGRRISEVIWDQKNNDKRMHGIRPMDIDYKDKQITFSILKKNPIYIKTKAGNIKTDEKLIREHMQKEAYNETIPYDSKLFKALEYWVPKIQPSNLSAIFPYNRIYVDKKLKEAAKKVKPPIDLGGVKTTIDEDGKPTTKPYQVSAHGFRHGFSVNFIKKNKNNPSALPILQDILCHSSVDVTKTYLRFNQDDKRRLLERAANETEDDE